MTFHHIKNEEGLQDTHWYVDLKVSDTKTVKNMLIDTGASISTLGIKTVARLYEQSETDIINYLKGSGVADKLEKYTATNDKIELYGIYIRNIKLGDTNLPVLKAYTRLDGYVSNLIGMDILAACEMRLDYTKQGTADMDLSLYNPDVLGAVEIKSLV